MKARTRSISAAVMMAVIIPIFAGLLACMPVPIGNPERSRIDPAMSGFWILGEEDNADALYLFRPYDKRTWLVIGVSPERGDLAEFEDLDIDSVDDMVEALRTHPVGEEGLTAEQPSIYKAWLTRIGGRRFMTWEAIGEIEDPSTFGPDTWLVFMVEEQRHDHCTMRMLIGDNDVFDELREAKKEDDWDPWKARRQWERVLRKNVSNPDLFTEDAFDMHRLPEDVVDKAAKLVEMTITE